MAVGGNIGHALANLPDVVTPDTVVVAELSSFQLEDIEAFRPDVAVLLNLTEDHLDRHGGYAGYVAAKLRIFENQTAGDLALLNADDPGPLAESVPGDGRRGVVRDRRRGGRARSPASPAAASGSRRTDGAATFAPWASSP